MNVVNKIIRILLIVSVISVICVQAYAYPVYAISKPAVVSRTEWGCPEGQSSPYWTYQYHTVTHVIIHHTDTPNNETDWPARVRQIWNYHYYTKGWKDIGYNYLIDPNGVIYEGRAGGDNVIAGHALPHNVGTMGVAFLGSFTSSDPTSAALRSAEALIAWKCSQNIINPLGSGADDYGTNYSFIAGHRDVSATVCPGDRLYALLPSIRQNVNNLISPSPQDKTLVSPSQGANQGRVYWLQNGKLYWITGSPDEAPGTDTINLMSTVPNWGWPLINKFSDGLLQNYSGWPGGVARFVKSNAESNGLLIRKYGDTKAYLVQNGKKYWLPNPDAVSYAGYSLADIIDVSDPINNFYPEVVNNSQKTAQSGTITVTPGQTFNISVTMKNTGTSVWAESLQYRLGWLSGYDPFPGNSSFIRQKLDSAESIATGSSRTWNVNGLTAPGSAGTYTISWQMLRENVNWFGETASIQVVVQPKTPDYVTLTLYVRDGSTSGPVLPGVLVTGTSGSGTSLTSQTTNSSGYVTMSGVAGTWQLSASKTGYQSSSWSSSVDITKTLTAYLVATTPPYSAGDKIAAYLNGAWYIDYNGNGAWNGTGGGDRLYTFGNSTMTPVSGDWDNDGTTEIGTYYNGAWYEDYSGNGVWGGVAGGDRQTSFGNASMKPVSGNWNGTGGTEIGTYLNGTWYLDYSGNGIWGGVAGGDRLYSFGNASMKPVTGDWNGDAITEIGCYLNGTWYLDYNGNGVWNGTGGGDMLYTFGNSSMTPITGNWNGTGGTEMGTYYNGTWYLDYSGNGVWGGVAGGDKQYSFGNGTMKPVSGAW